MAVLPELSPCQPLSTRASIGVSQAKVITASARWTDCNRRDASDSFDDMSEAPFPLRESRRRWHSKSPYLLGHDGRGATGISRHARYRSSKGRSKESWCVRPIG